MTEAIALARGLEALSGQLIDVDSHEMMPAQIWTGLFGSEVKELADAVIEHSLPWVTDNNSHNVPDFAGDNWEIAEDLMIVKGPKAPGAVDVARRLDVMDAMGVKRQLMYPTGLGGWSMTLLMAHKYDPGLLPTITGDRAAKAARWLDIYNEWILTQTSVSNRIRPVPTLVGDTVEELMKKGRRMLDAGIRAVMLPAGLPPAGKSPAHPDLEPFWAMMEEADCTVTLHLGSEGKYFETIRAWRDAPVFEGYRGVGEFSSDPWYTSMVHVPSQTFVQTMVLGGVFVRHPNLRFGVIEVGAYWVSPMLRNMDMWYGILKGFRIQEKRLPELPSSYVKSNVRVSVFPWEDLERYVKIEGLEDIICFASDYPHLEGGRDMMNDMYRKIAACGPEVTRKFFATNGEFLVPE